MTAAVIERWIAFIEADGDGHDQEALNAMLADDVVFHSPALFKPQEGRAKTVMYLSAAAKVLGGKDFRYVGQWFGEKSAVLEFEATVDGLYVNGVDMIGWNDDEFIDSFKVMLRPFKGLQAIMPRMAELLQ